MRALVVQAGPNFSVKDVGDGWIRGLTANGVDVLEMDLHNVLYLYTCAHIERDGEWVPAMTVEEGCWAAAEHIKSYCFTWWPDVVFVVSGFFIGQPMVDALTARGMRLVWILTESPYEDDAQLDRVARGGALAVVNDPTNIGRYRELLPTVYVPHSYNPAVHRPGPVHPDYQSDVCIVGTGFPSRVEHLSQVDWTGVDLALCGMWKALEGLPLAKHVRGASSDDDLEQCIDNVEAVRWYQSTEMSINLYRREAERPELSAGWAMGPREVELAACGTFFITEERGENREVLPFVPTTSGPVETQELVRWWLAHEDERHRVIRQAKAAVAGWTFEARAAEVLRLLDRQPARA